MHPDGDPTGRFGPCTHVLEVVARDTELGLVFHDCDQAFRDRIKGWVRKLADWGIHFGRPRTLHVLNRPFLNGPYDNVLGSEAGKDPFWSHCFPVEVRGRRYIQIAREHPDSTAAHELGHAITGDRCVFLASLGGSHRIDEETKPGLALSEGWADFVSAALLLGKDASPASWAFSSSTVFDLEQGKLLPADPTSGETPKAIEASAGKEICVAFAIWDLFDGPQDGVDRVTIEFGKLFRVFQPTFATLTPGPVIRDIEDFMDRVCRNEGKDVKRCASIDGIRKLHTP